MKEELKIETQRYFYEAMLYELAKSIGIVSERIKTRKIVEAYRGLLEIEKIYSKMGEERKKFSNRFKKDLLSLIAELELVKEERRVKIEDVTEIDKIDNINRNDYDLGEIQKKLDEMIRKIK